MRYLGTIITLVLLLGVPSASLLAGEDPFAKETFTGTSGEVLPYRWLTPTKVSKSKRYPLVIFLHGAGERGEDNEAQLRHCARAFAKPKMRKENPCYVIAPQCAKNHRWVEVNWGDPKPHSQPETPSQGMGLLLELLPKLIKENRVDTKRIYVVGLSMGGYGVWDLLMRRPKLFAAGISMCGGADNSKAKSIASIPVWVWHGGADKVVPIVRSQSMVKALKEAGGKPIYTEVPGMWHGVWGKAFSEPKLLPWLFKQKLKKKPTL